MLTALVNYNDLYQNRLNYHNFPHVENTKQSHVGCVRLHADGGACELYGYISRLHFPHYCSLINARTLFTEAWEGGGHLELRLAFSRDQPQKVYVQHLIERDGADLWRLLVGGQRSPVRVRRRTAHGARCPPGGADARASSRQRVR